MKWWDLTELYQLPSGCFGIFLWSGVHNKHFYMLLKSWTILLVELSPKKDCLLDKNAQKCVESWVIGYDVPSKVEQLKKDDLSHPCIGSLC